MEPGETPVTFSDQLRKTLSKDTFPRYCAFERKGQEGNFLTPKELIVQTDKFMKRFGEIMQKQELPDTVFFLDKSARPVAYMFGKLFPIYYPGEKMPEIRFVNVGGSGSRLYDTDSRPFTGNPEIIRQTYGGRIKTDGRIAIVDEYSHTGQASKHATEALNKAFPEAIVTTMVAYDKLPNWYQNKNYLGVEEYTKYDYERKALEKLNQELGTEYKDRWEMTNDNTKPNTVSSRFWEIYQEMKGTIPYVKKGKHIQTRYQQPKPSFIQKVKGEKPKPVELKTNVFREARVELDKFCEEIIKRKNQREAS